jgi:hypothetical protein
MATRISIMDRVDDQGVPVLAATATAVYPGHRKTAEMLAIDS